jgi:hypothetical protein
VKVTVNPYRQVVHGGRHHFSGDVIDLDAGTAERWSRLGWVSTDKALPQRDAHSMVHARANVQKRIREELAVDATRSDRAIAKVVGCDHKTVAAQRKR